MQSRLYINQSVLLPLPLILLPATQLVYFILSLSYYSQQFLVNDLCDLTHDWSLSDCIEQRDCSNEEDHEYVHEGVFFVAEPDVIVDKEEDGHDEVDGHLFLVGFVPLTDHCCVLVGGFALEVLLDSKDAVRLQEGLGGLVVIEVTQDHGGTALGL